MSASGSLQQPIARPAPECTTVPSDALFQFLTQKCREEAVMSLSPRWLYCHAHDCLFDLQDDKEIEMAFRENKEDAVLGAVSLTDSSLPHFAILMLSRASQPDEPNNNKDQVKVRIFSETKQELQCTQTFTLPENTAAAVSAYCKRNGMWMGPIPTNQSPMVVKTFSNFQYLAILTSFALASAIQNTICVLDLKSGETFQCALPGGGLDLVEFNAQKMLVMLKKRFNDVLRCVTVDAHQKTITVGDVEYPIMGTGQRHLGLLNKLSFNDWFMMREMNALSMCWLTPDGLKQKIMAPHQNCVFFPLNGETALLDSGNDLYLDAYREKTLKKSFGKEEVERIFLWYHYGLLVLKKSGVDFVFFRSLFNRENYMSPMKNRLVSEVSTHTLFQRTISSLVVEYLGISDDEFRFPRLLQQARIDAGYRDNVEDNAVIRRTY